MPSDRNTAYPFLEQMRTEELEALLQQEFTAADGGEPDVDYIMAIMEVMKQRDANPPAAEVDVDAAWRDFKENYQGQASAYETEVLPERDSSCDVTRSVSKMTEIEGRGGKRWDKPKKAEKSRDCGGGKF